MRQVNTDDRLCSYDSHRARARASARSSPKPTSSAIVFSLSPCAVSRTTISRRIPSCPKTGSAALCGLRPILAQYPAEAFVASDRSLACLPGTQRDDVVEALVIALVVIVLDVFTHDGSKMPLANGHDVTQALGLDRPDETLGVGVQVRASRRQAQQLHVGRCQDLLEVSGVQEIGMARPPSEVSRPGTIVAGGSRARGRSHCEKRSDSCPAQFRDRTGKVCLFPSMRTSINLDVRHAYNH